MKRLFLLLFLSTISFAQIPAEPEDKTPQWEKHERTEFYAKDGKTLCGRLVQYDTAKWKVFVKDGMSVPRFDTRDEAVKWIKAYCPVAGKVAFKK